MNAVTKSLLLCYLLLLPIFTTAQSAKLAITLADKLILIEGKVDDRIGYFLLDLGVSDVILNSAHFEGVISKEKGVYGLNGRLSTAETKRVNLSLGNIQWKNRLTYLLPLNHLEAAKGKEILGLIGGALFNKCKLLIDLSQMTVEIEKASSGESTASYDQHDLAPTSILPFKLKGGMPWVEVRLNHMFFKFGMDTACEYSLISAKLLPFLEDLIFNKREVNSRGVSAKIKQVTAAKLTQLEVGLLTCHPIGILFVDMGLINQNIPGAKLDGILGFDFLRQFKVAINYHTREIGLWRHPSATKHPILLTQEVSRDSIRLGY
ncbi:MAG: hypothetical protein R2828_11090 [Saprospiraceae bacterium]